MDITAYVLIEIDKARKSFIVELKHNLTMSEENVKIMEEEEKIFEIAQKKGYKIICDEKVIFDPEKIKERLIKEQQENSKYIEEENKRYMEIIKKDITKLTKEEIVFLAKYRAAGKHLENARNCRPGYTAEDEYKRIVDYIEQKKQKDQEKQINKRTF